MKKILSVLLTLTLILSITSIGYAGESLPEVKELTISDVTTSGISVSGTVNKTGMYAVTVQVLNGTTIVANESFPIDESKAFVGTFDGLSLAYSTTYTVRAANYEGGTWKTATFTTGAAPYVPPYIPPVNPTDDTATPTQVLVTDEMVKELVKGFTVTTRTVNQKRGIKIYVNDIDGLQEIKDAGYTVVYDFYNVCQKAVPKNKQYKLTKVRDKEDAWYLNTAVKRGNKYYYKAILKVKNTDGKVIAQTTLEQGKYGCRTRK